MNLTKPATGPLPLHSKESVLSCPYCRKYGWADDNLKVWRAKSVATGLVTRWTRCESCHAMWREVYNWELHHYEYAEHWKPLS